MDQFQPLPYNRRTVPREQLELTLISRNVPLEDLNKIMDAYEMAQSVHAQQLRPDGTPYFYHIARTCNILAEEARVTDADVLCAALLHDVLEENTDGVTKEILAYNFGDYVAYIVETLTKNLEAYRANPEAVDAAHLETLRKSNDDCLIVRFAARLDNFRCLEFNLKRNPIRYIQQTTEQYIPLADNTQSSVLLFLIRELKKERNRFVG